MKGYNMMSIKGNSKSYIEILSTYGALAETMCGTFEFEIEDRLTYWHSDLGTWDDECQYTADGNIQYRTRLGYYDYHPTSDVRPHAVKGVENTSGRVSGDSHDLTFNDLGKVSYISSHENGSYGIVYGPDGGRWESSLYKTGSQWPDTVHRYVGDMEIVSSGPSEVCRFYYLGHGVVLRKVNNSVTPLYAFTDNLGSVTRLYTVTGTEKFRAQYDPWGVQVVNKNDVNFARGYCGHEMLDDFQLINMNGRMYDPVLGRFLSPDNYVQMPTSAQSFNRYSYCLNNPLKYIDTDGEFAWIPILAFLGGMMNVIANSNNINSSWDALKYFGVGFASGAAGAYVGGVVASAIGIGGAIGGAVSGFVGGAVSGGILGGGNAYFGDAHFWQGFGHGVIYGGIIGGIGGGIIGGVCSVAKGNNFWTGAAKQAIIKPEVNWDPDVIPEPMRGTQTFEPQWHDLPETPMPEWVQTPLNEGHQTLDNVVYECVGNGETLLNNNAFTVTPNGIVLPKNIYIPQELVENPYRIGSFGKIIDGKYIEILRIDNGTFTGFKGPNNSHFHLNGNKEHIFDINRWPWKR